MWYNDCSEEVASPKNKQDESAFSLDGTNFMNKSRFIPYLVRMYLEQNPSLTFAELQAKFPDTLLASNFRRLGVLVTKEAMDASTRDIKQKQKWYYVKDSTYLLTSGDGVQFYVNNQWTIDKIQPILKMAEADDIVLLAGKGHETYQIIGNSKIPFNERDIIKEYFD